jgi:hypothetical protein
LQPTEGLKLIYVKVVAVVKPAPMPDNSTRIDLAEVPSPADKWLLSALKGILIKIS